MQRTETSAGYFWRSTGNLIEIQQPFRQSRKTILELTLSRIKFEIYGKEVQKGMVNIQIASYVFITSIINESYQNEILSMYQINLIKRRISLLCQTRSIDINFLQFIIYIRFQNFCFCQQIMAKFLLYNKQFGNKNIWFMSMLSEESPIKPQLILDLQSFIKPHIMELSMKKNKKQKVKQGDTKLYQDLKKINEQSSQKKRQVIAKYLKKSSEQKDPQKVIQKIQKQGNQISILQVAISLSKYNNNMLKQLLDTKTIEQKEAKQTQEFQINKKILSDPILYLLSDSQIMKKISPKSNQSSFVDYKHVSFKDKNQLIDLEKGKFKKNKVHNFQHFQKPKQLKQLKKQLLSLPYINRYRNILDIKKGINHINHKKIIVQQASQIKNISELNKSINSFEQFKKSKRQKLSEEQLLEKTLNKAISKGNYRSKTQFQSLNSPIYYQGNNNDLKIFNNNLYKSQLILQNKGQKSIIKQLKKDSYSSIRDTIKDTDNQSEINPEQKSTKINLKDIIDIKPQKGVLQKCWPSYIQYSFDNRKKSSQLKNIKQKIDILIGMTNIPSQQTLSIYYALKRMQDKDLQKLKNQSLMMQKQFSNTKYKIKYRNLKQSYHKKMKKYIKERKMNEFELQQHKAEQSKHYVFKQIKLNKKMLERRVMVDNKTEE